MPLLMLRVTPRHAQAQRFHATAGFRRRRRTCFFLRRPFCLLPLTLIIATRRYAIFAAFRHDFMLTLSLPCCYVNSRYADDSRICHASASPLMLIRLPPLPQRRLRDFAAMLMTLSLCLLRLFLIRFRRCRHIRFDVITVIATRCLLIFSLFMRLILMNRRR